ncbi:MAG: hypothetical protein ACP5QZ_10010, partial [Candidatus Sumerlaeaceae bacterium]
INGKQAVHLGTSEIATSGNTGHNPPAPANELRSVSQFASFRDIVFSPSGSGPFPAPTEPEKSDHAAGKVVTFYVSDGTNVASKSIVVATKDNQFDALSGGSQFTQVHDDPVTGTATSGWTLEAGIPSGSTTGDFDSANGAIRVRILSDASNRYRAQQWFSDIVVPYGSVGSSNWVRAKFYVYATGHTPAQANVIPSVRMRLMQRFVIANTLEVWTHTPGLPALEPYGAELEPNTDSNNPSVYRVDFDPPEVPQNVNNPATEGIQVSFSGYTTANPDNGYLGLTEVVIGTYPAILGTQVKEYAGSAIVDDTVNEPAEVYSLYFPSGSQPGYQPAPDTGTKPTVTKSSGGVTVDSTSSAFGIDGSGNKRTAIVQFTVDAGLPYSDRVRFDVGKLYQVRYHITSTRNSNAQAQMRLFLRFGGYLYNLLYEVGGAYALPGAEARALAWQHLPGVGNQNPDKEVPGENGCWYTLLLSSPLNGEIRPDVSGPITTKMPNLTSLPGPGQNVDSPRRDLKIGFGFIDTLSSDSNQNLEGMLYTVDKIRVYVADEPEP